MPRVASILVVAALACGASAFAADPEPFELRDGDRVVFLGNALIEREQKYGFWEAMLMLTWPERTFTFRNLGWSGDTVWGESRAGFGTAADGFKALTSQVNEAKPTVIFVGYGNVEAFAGKAGLPKFVDGFNQLLDVLEATKARLVVLGPTLQNGAVTTNPNWKAYNQQVVEYSNAMRGVAEKRKHRFVDLSQATGEDFFQSDGLLGSTDDGVTFIEFGYLGLFEVIAEQLAFPVNDLLEKDVGEDDPLMDLIDLIVKKNELFFHRWRPQNETYLFGFRKHEQGNNAEEVFQFDPLVVAEEKKIEQAKQTVIAATKKAGVK